MSEKELEEKVLAYRVIEARLNSLVKNREIIASKIIEIQNTISSLESMNKNDEILFSLGSETYAFGKITDKKVLMEVGSNVVFKKNVENALESLKKRRGELENSLKQVEHDIGEMVSALDQLGTEIENISNAQK